MANDIKIGTVIDYDGAKLIVTESRYNAPDCTGCFFSDWERRKLGLSKLSCYVHNMACTPYQRKDKRHIIFKEVMQQ